MSRILNLYLKGLQSHPWKIQLMTTGFLMGSGDVIAQTLIENRNIKELDLPRTARFVFLGSCFVAPALKVWYHILEKGFGAIGRTVGLKKMLCDQLMFTPCFLGSFLTVFGVVNFQPWDAIKAKVKDDYFNVLKANYMLWPGAQLITFYLIPFHLRIVFVSIVALFWNTYLAYQTNKTL